MGIVKGFWRFRIFSYLGFGSRGSGSALHGWRVVSSSGASSLGAVRFVAFGVLLAALVSVIPFVTLLLLVSVLGRLLMLLRLQTGRFTSIIYT